MSEEQAIRGEGALFNYPRQAEFGRILPKNKIYERSGASTRLKELFVEQVERIVWRYKLAPETINLPAKPEVPEIQVFAIQLKTHDLHRDVLRCIDGAVQFPVIFELIRESGAGSSIQVVAAYKHPSAADSGKWVLSDYLATDWLPAATPRLTMPLAIDMAGLYEQLLRRLIPLQSKPGETLDALVLRLEQFRNKRSEIGRVEARLAKEKQFNRKVEINAVLKKLRAEMEQLGVIK